ncbi:YihY/virulence factor BrkB family protein [Aeromicrobium sp.]|nr:YihY/virulence factor BrkB family protein [Candidatus Saccharibacteria bacterium]
MKLVSFIKQTFKEFSKDKVSQLSAAFAYVAIFSIGPVLLILISVIGLIYGDQAAQGQLADKLSGTIGADTAKTLQGVISSSQSSGSGVLALAIGIVGSLLGASAITGQLQTSLNTIFEVVPDPKAGFKRAIYVKLKNVGLIIAGSALVLASLVLSAFIAGLGKKIEDQFGIPAIALESINTVVSLTVFIGLIYALYRIVPDVRIPRKIVMTAALAVAVLFILGKIILGIVIGRNGTAGAYGAAASLITLLLWVYYSGQILYFGAEGVKVYCRTQGIGFNAKRFALKHETFTLDSQNGIGAIIESWHRGYTNTRDKEK